MSQVLESKSDFGPEVGVFKGKSPSPRFSKPGVTDPQKNKDYASLQFS